MSGTDERICIDGKSVVCDGKCDTCTVKSVKLDYNYIFEFVVRSPKGISLCITNDMANIIIKDYSIVLKCSAGDMSGEESGLFDYNGETIRIKRTWTKLWKLYRGKWESDPHWTGD